MSPAELSRSIAVTERSLADDDPALARRARRLVRHDTMQVVAVVALLALGAVLAAGGLGNRSILLCGGRAGSLSLSVLVDAAGRRLLRRTPHVAAGLERDR